jgi:hypothetical protein
MAVWATNCVNVRNRLIWRFENAIEEFHLVHNTKWATLLRRAIVCMHNQNGVIQLTQFAKTFNESTNLIVRVIQESCKCFLQTRS